jgi:hypothetical protein
MIDMFGQPQGIEKDATFSDCKRYRYTLSRTWDAGAHPLPIVMLNPSTADADLDDPTIKRCMEFARRDGFGGIRVTNLFAYRATSPKDMKAVADPVGEMNDAALEVLFEKAEEAGIAVLAAWGTHGTHRDRAATVMAIARAKGARLACLGVTKDGHPKHPLYVLGTRPLEALR